VRADLLRRGGRIIACHDGPQCPIEAQAPLATLLGYDAALAELTAGTACHQMRLSHYAPLQ
jgi:translation elongation factor EF-G